MSEIRTKFCLVFQTERSDFGHLLYGLLPALSQLQNVLEKIEEIFFVRFQFGQDQRDEGVHVVVDDGGSLAGIDGQEGEQLLQDGLLDGTFLVASTFNPTGKVLRFQKNFL